MRRDHEVHLTVGFVAVDRTPEQVEREVERLLRQLHVSRPGLTFARMEKFPVLVDGEDYDDLPDEEWFGVYWSGEQIAALDPK